MASSSVTPAAVELGFVQKCPSWLLKSKFFRSKMGGKPAWLALNNLPERERLVCGNCGKPRSFLLQVYAPLEDNDDAFHRTIFLFVCTNGKCSSIAAFRSQLPRKNEFYSFEPPVEVEDTASSSPASPPLCDVCGCRGDLKCENCEERVYCCESHRDIDVKSGHDHNTASSADGKKKKKKPKNDFLLPEYEVVTDTENLPPPTKEKSDAEKMLEYEQFLRSAKAKDCMQEGQLDDVEKFITKPDKIFSKFQKRVALEPEQILRYQRGGVPLWVSPEHIPSSSDVPNCDGCGAERIFEFQVMPQLLNYLNLDSIEDSVDWGTLICYTCSKSCNAACTAYIDEFVWKQDFANDSVDK